MGRGRRLPSPVHFKGAQTPILPALPFLPCLGCLQAHLAVFCINKLLYEEAYGLSLSLSLTAWGHLCPVALSGKERWLQQALK